MGEKQVVIVLDEDLWRRVRAQAVLEGKTAKEWVAEALERALKEKARKG